MESSINNVTGIIQYIKVTKEGEKFGKKWKLYTIKINEVFYSAFGNEDNDPYCHYSEGDNVSIEYVQKGEYKNVKSIKLSVVGSEDQFKKYEKKSPEEPTINKILEEGIFNGEFEINGEVYKLTISKK